MSAEGEAINPPSGCIYDAPALNLSASDFDRRIHLAIHEEDRSLTAVFLVQRGVVRARIREVDRAVGEEAVIGKDQQLFAYRRGERIIRRADDDTAEESLPYRVAGTMVGMRV